MSNSKFKNIWVIGVDGQEVDFDGAVSLMDDEIRETVIGSDTESNQEFMDLYCRLHEEKFGEEFVVN